MVGELARAGSYFCVRSALIDKHGRMRVSKHCPDSREGPYSRVQDAFCFDHASNLFSSSRAPEHSRFDEGLHQQQHGPGGCSGGGTEFLCLEQCAPCSDRSFVKFSTVVARLIAVPVVRRAFLVLLTCTTSRGATARHILVVCIVSAKNRRKTLASGATATVDFPLDTGGRSNGWPWSLSLFFWFFVLCAVPFCRTCMIFCQTHHVVGVAVSAGLADQFGVTSYPSRAMMKAKLSRHIWECAWLVRGRTLRSG